LTSLSWADKDNYRINYDEQKVRIRVPDMSKFDHNQLIEVFTNRGLIGVAIAEFKKVDDLPPAANAAAVREAVKPLNGEWHTDESAEQKFWLKVSGNTIRLHTVDHGFWSTTTSRIHDAGDDWLHFGIDPAKSNELRYQLKDAALNVQIKFPSSYQGEFKLYRPVDE